jgi:parallel beta-helix repeat protein
VYSAREFTPTASTYKMSGIEMRGTSTIVEGNSIHDVQIGVQVNTDGGIVTGRVTDNTFTLIDVGNEENADCVFVGSTLRDAAYGLVIEDNDCSGYTDDGIDLYGGKNVIVEDNYIHDSGESTTSNAALKMGGPSDTPPGTDRSGNIARRNLVLVRGGGSQADFCMVANGLVGGIIESNIMRADTDASACVEINEFGTGAGGGGTGNTFRNNVLDGKKGLYVRTEAGADTTAYNNILIGTVSDINVETSATVTGANNYLSTETKAGNGTYTTSGDVTGAIDWVGGTLPTTAAGFHLSAGSALRRAGKDLNIGNVQDCENQAFNHPPDIGACGTNSGDAAAARTAR